MTTEYVIARIRAIEQELADLKKVLISEIEIPKKTKLKGLWKGINVTDEDIEEAKHAIFRDAYNFKG
jgi:hypothetical protein